MLAADAPPLRSGRRLPVFHGQRTLSVQNGFPLAMVLGVSCSWLDRLIG